MPEVSEGELTIDFGVVKLSGKLSEQDRQCAWQLYTEMVTRVAVSGKRRDDSCTDFSGEIMAESLESLHAFFREARNIMKSFPVGKLKEKNQRHLGIFIHDLLADVIRPFLEEWQADFRSWWERQDRSERSWFDLQKSYPRHGELIGQWTRLRKLMRSMEKELREQYKLQGVG